MPGHAVRVAATVFPVFPVVPVSPVTPVVQMLFVFRRDAALLRAPTSGDSGEHGRTSEHQGETRRLGY